MSDLITTDLVRLDAGLGPDKHEVIRALAAVVDEAGRATDVDQLVEDALAREATSRHRPARWHRDPALPHRRRWTSRRSRSPGSSPPVDFGAKDGPADLAFLIAAPAGGDSTHLQLLTKLARALVKPAFTDALREAETPEEVVDLVAGVGRPRRARRRTGRPAAAAAAPAPAATAVAAGDRARRLRPRPRRGRAAWSR